VTRGDFGTGWLQKYQVARSVAGYSLCFAYHLQIGFVSAGRFAYAGLMALVQKLPNF
jgi:hypothetical protein